jgi:hypothetical protein
MERTMSALSNFLKKAGGLHDAAVRTITWHLGTRVLEVAVEDIYQNFENLPEYPGCTPGSVVLKGISRLGIDVISRETLHVQEFLVEEKSAGEYVAAISFWPQGKVTATFSNAEVPDFQLARTGAG